MPPAASHPHLQLAAGSDGPPVLRFAPSPNGELHAGHALSALTTWNWAQRLGGRFLLRIEDIDTSRAREHLIAQIFDDLAWLDLDWDRPVLRQSEHFADYREAARRLEEMGLLYPCFATRSEIRAAVAALEARGTAVRRDPDGAPLYPGLHRNLESEEVARRKADGEPFALRLDVAKAMRLARRLTASDVLTYTALDDPEGPAQIVTARPQGWGDAVIVRKDVPASYHLAVVVDDARQGVTHVTRGKDLEAATDLHRLLQVLLGFAAPNYHHHRLITDANGAKLAKRAGSESLRALREKGASPADIRALVGLA